MIRICFVVLGIIWAVPALAVVDDVCPERFPITVGGDTLYMPYCAYASDLETTGQTQWTKAVIILHGSSRTAQDNLNAADDGLSQSGQTGTTMLIAPQFLAEEDVDAFSLDTEIYWLNGTSNWRDGDELSGDTAGNPRAFQLQSSFLVMDRIVERLTDPTYFPNITEIWIAGHSAGGGFVPRYADTSTEHDNVPSGVTITYIGANGTPLYYSDKRWNGSSFSTPSGTGCDSTYNDWRYGLEDMKNYPLSIGSSTIIANAQARRHVTLAGELDNDPDHPDLLTTCAANLTGTDRLDRMQKQYAHIQDEFGAGITDTWKFFIMPGVAHSFGSSWRSPCFKELVYGIDNGGVCTFEISAEPPPPTPDPLPDFSNPACG